MTAQNSHATDNHQPITHQNYKEVMAVFWSELVCQALPYLIVGVFGVTVAFVVWISFWVLVLLIPIGAVVWHYFKKSKKNLNP